ncbi:diguanylate cyclase [Xylophilus sp. Kf1]|nr:diguanylate cyclase [Xylophilus sp. Kf1]
MTLRRAASSPAFSPGARGRVWRRAAVVPLVMLGLTLAAWMVAGWREQTLVQAQARQVAARTVDAANERIQRYFDLAIGLGGLLRVSEGLSRREFHDQYEMQQIAARYPGVLALQYAPLVLEANRARFEASVRADRSMSPSGYPGFAIHPPGPRPSYLPVLFNEPMLGNEQAFGYDAASNPALREVQQRARDSGRPELSQTLPLVQGGRAVLLRYAVYQRGSRAVTIEQRRGTYRGQLGVVLDMQVLMAGLLATGDAHWRMRIEDIGLAGDDTLQPVGLLYDSAPQSEESRHPAAPLVRELAVGGRQWRMTFLHDAPLPWLRAVPMAVMAGGIAFSLLMVVVSRGSRRKYEKVALRERRSRHDAEHDHLTGLPNRAFFERSLRRSLEAATERGERLALLFIDLDAFKSINDHHGHAVGDVVLRAVASRLQTTLRGDDMVARLGGDEFVVLLQRARESVWQRTAQRVHESMRAPVADGDLRLMVELSIGVAVFPDDAQDADMLMRRADGAMYRAKRSRGD